MISSVALLIVGSAFIVLVYILLSALSRIERDLGQLATRREIAKFRGESE